MPFMHDVPEVFRISVVYGDNIPCGRGQKVFETAFETVDNVIGPVVDKSVNGCRDCYIET